MDNSVENYAQQFLQYDCYNSRKRYTALLSIL